VGGVGGGGGGGGGGGSRIVKALAFNQCNLGSNPGLGIMRVARGIQACCTCMFDI